LAFYSIGNGASVTLKEIKDYAKASRTQSSFRHNYLKWVKKVGGEFKNIIISANPKKD